MLPAPPDQGFLFLNVLKELSKAFPDSGARQSSRADEVTVDHSCTEPSTHCFRCLYGHCRFLMRNYTYYIQHKPHTPINHTKLHASHTHPTPYHTHNIHHIHMQTHTHITPQSHTHTHCTINTTHATYTVSTVDQRV